MASVVNGLFPLFEEHTEVLEAVLIERQRQLDKFGPQNRPPFEWFLILSEEVGEVAKECVEMQFDDVNHPHADPERYYKEMVEVAAVAFAAIQNYNERKRIANESNWYFWAQTEEDKETAVEALAVRGFSVPNDDSPRYRYIYFDTVMDAFNTVFSRPGRVSKQIEVSSLEEFIARIESNRRYTPVVATASAEVH